MSMTSTLETVSQQLRTRPFIPPTGLRNRHIMTIVGSLRPRTFSILNNSEPERREFRTEPGTRVVAFCHWQPQPRQYPTIIIIHGLEGSSDAKYVLGTSDKALKSGFNVLRLNVRGCGGTAHLSPRLYHSGLTVDLHSLTRELIERDKLPELYLIGFSMGGNQALKFAGELGNDAPRQIRGLSAISPPIDLEACSLAIARIENRIYESQFLSSLKKTMHEKDRLFPGIYDLSRLKNVRHLWDWDDAFQRYNGFHDARDYYAQASSLRFIPRLRIPTLIIHAHDDPFIPFESFADRRISDNPSVFLLESRHGGHVAFFGIRQPDEDRSWAENRAVEFCRALTGLLDPKVDGLKFDIRESSMPTL
ncbi:MAG: alpha/beta fold hydrolase [Acidobacteria bacterium]|nr:alpha/beta fold hydrolase [Acidobacteriota bacterium]